MSGCLIDCYFQEQIDNETLAYKLPDGSVIDVRTYAALPNLYTTENVGWPCAV